MNGSPAPKHIAVVPVVGLDQRAAYALECAGRLAPRVLAVHVRGPEDGRVHELEATWAKRAPTVPLLILDGSAGDWERPFLRALDALRRTAQADLITVVVPPRWSGARPDSRQGPSAVGALRLALRRRPGVVVRSLPSIDSTPD